MVSTLPTPLRQYEPSVFPSTFPSDAVQEAFGGTYIMAVLPSEYGQNDTLLSVCKSPYVPTPIYNTVPFLQGCYWFSGVSWICFARP